MSLRERVSFPVIFSESGWVEKEKVKPKAKGHLPFHSSTGKKKRPSRTLLHFLELCQCKKNHLRDGSFPIAAVSLFRSWWNSAVGRLPLFRDDY